MDRAETSESAEAAIGAGDDAFPAHDIGETFDPLRHQLRMFNEIGRGIERAWDQDLVIGDISLRPTPPLVLMTRIGSLELNRLRLR